MARVLVLHARGTWMMNPAGGGILMTVEAALAKMMIGRRGSMDELRGWIDRDVIGEREGASPAR